MPDYQKFYKRSRYSKSKPYNITDGDTIKPSDGECFTNDGLNEALKALKKISGFPQKKSKWNLINRI